MLDNSVALVPASFRNVLFLFLAFSFALLLFGFVFRVLMGAHCTPNRVISGSIGVLFVYAVTIFIYTLDPWRFSQYLSPLPFAIFRRDILIITSLGSDSFSLLASQVLSMLILCFIVHLLYYFLPTGRKLFSWLFWRVLSIGLAIFLNLAANWVLNSFLPDVVAAYASTAVIIILAAAFLIGLFNPLLCVIFTFVNPVFGLLYTFFFSNIIGKQLTKAVFSAGVLCLSFYIANYFGYGVLDITSQALLSYVPFLAALAGVWFLFDRKL